MQLFNFLAIATKDERDEFCRITGRKLSYLRKLGKGAKKCAPYTAFEIQEATRLLAAKNPNLAFVPGESIVNDKARYLKLVADIPKRAPVASQSLTASAP